MRAVRPVGCCWARRRPPGDKRARRENDEPRANISTCENKKRKTRTKRLCYAGHTARQAEEQPAAIVIKSSSSCQMRLIHLFFSSLFSIFSFSFFFQQQFPVVQSSRFGHAPSCFLRSSRPTTTPGCCCGGRVPQVALPPLLPCRLLLGLPVVISFSLSFFLSFFWVYFIFCLVSFAAGSQ